LIPAALEMGNVRSSHRRRAVWRARAPVEAREAVMPDSGTRSRESEIRWHACLKRVDRFGDGVQSGHRGLRLEQGRVIVIEFSECLQAPASIALPEHAGEMALHEQVRIVPYGWAMWLG
jgi:hypothetical protein